MRCQRKRFGCGRSEQTNGRYERSGGCIPLRLRCDVYAVGGVLYARGEAAGEAPFAELVRSEISGEAMLRYIAADELGRGVALEISIQDAMVRNWHFYMVKGERGGA